MKTLKKIASVCMAAMILVTSAIGVSAAPVAEATIDTNRKGSITVYKYDLSATRS